MNKKELSKYYYLSIEIKDLEERIQEVRNKSVGVSRITGMPFSGGKSNPVEQRAELLIKLENQLEAKKTKAIKKLMILEEYISTIDDSEIRVIFTKRYIELKKWDTIAKEMFMSERTVYRRHSKYLKSERKETDDSRS